VLMMQTSILAQNGNAPMMSDIEVMKLAQQEADAKQAAVQQKINDSLIVWKTKLYDSINGVKKTLLSPGDEGYAEMAAKRNKYTEELRQKQLQEEENVAKSKIKAKPVAPKNDLYRMLHANEMDAIEFKQKNEKLLAKILHQKYVVKQFNGTDISAAETLEFSLADDQNLQLTLPAIRTVSKYKFDQQYFYIQAIAPTDNNSEATDNIMIHYLDHVRYIWDLGNGDVQLLNEEGAVVYQLSPKK
jgi:hypothetical protein